MSTASKSTALRAVREQTRAEIAQHGVVEADIRQLQAQHVFPVDPGANRVGRLVRTSRAEFATNSKVRKSLVGDHGDQDGNSG